MRREQHADAVRCHSMAPRHAGGPPASRRAPMTRPRTRRRVVTGRLIDHPASPCPPGLVRHVGNTRPKIASDTLRATRVDSGRANAIPPLHRGTPRVQASRIEPETGPADRRRLAAAGLSALVPGLGQALNRRPRLAALFLVPSADLFPPPGTRPTPWPTPEPTKSPRPTAQPTSEPTASPPRNRAPRVRSRAPQGAAPSAGPPAPDGRSRASPPVSRDPGSARRRVPRPARRSGRSRTRRFPAAP